jgi:hypothetical protein
MDYDISTFEMLNISNVDDRRKKIGGNSHARCNIVRNVNALQMDTFFSFSFFYIMI